MKRPTLVHEVELRATAEEVWRAITDPAFVEQYFFGFKVRGRWHRGARVVYETPGGTPQIEGKLLEVIPARRLSMSVRLLRDAETETDLPSRVTWEIEPLGEMCRLTVVHDEFERETPTYRAVAGGWPLALAGLKELLETGQATTAQLVWPEHLKRPPRFAGSARSGARLSRSK